MLLIPAPNTSKRLAFFQRFRLVWFAALALLVLFAAAAHAQGGPPFRTDDPETPGNKHWEINFGWIGERNPAAGAYRVPDFDFNYGLGDRIQLRYEIPIAIALDLQGHRGAIEWRHPDSERSGNGHRSYGHFAGGANGLGFVGDAQSAAFTCPAERR
jgi:hypothetical protein